MLRNHSSAHTLHQVAELGKRCQVTALAAEKAEQIAAAAMSAAEAAVRDEMEAAAVAKESQVALVKALQEIAVLEDSQRKAERDEETRAKQCVDLQGDTKDRQIPVSRRKQAESKDAVKPGVKPEQAAALTASPDAETRAPTIAAASKERREEAKAAVCRPFVRVTAMSHMSLLTGGAQGPAAGELSGRHPHQRQLFCIVLAEVRLHCRYLTTDTISHSYKVPVVAVLTLALGYACLNTAAGAALHAKAASLANTLAGPVSGLVSQLPAVSIPHGVEDYLVTIWLLLTACVAVPLVCQLPGGSAVLGFLVCAYVLSELRSCPEHGGCIMHTHAHTLRRLVVRLLARTRLASSKTSSTCATSRSWALSFCCSTSAWSCPWSACSRCKSLCLAWARHR